MTRRRSRSAFSQIPSARAPLRVAPDRTPLGHQPLQPAKVELAYDLTATSGLDAPRTSGLRRSQHLSFFGTGCALVVVLPFGRARPIICQRFEGLKHAHRTDRLNRICALARNITGAGLPAHHLGSQLALLMVVLHRHGAKNPLQRHCGMAPKRLRKKKLLYQRGATNRGKGNVCRFRQSRLSVDRSLHHQS